VHASISDEGLRERKKRLTSETIIRVALDLFESQGFRATTLTQIAEAAQIVPSTLYAYFKSKEDILFSVHDAVRASITDRIVDRPANETAAEAIAAWIAEVQPAIIEGTSKTNQAIINSDPELRNSERLRLAFQEDEFAKAFATELRKRPDELEPRLMASVVMNVFLTIWQWWIPQQDDGHLDMRELTNLEITYITSLIRAAEDVLKSMPNPRLVLAGDHRRKTG